mgnify:CR=1 FL=1
MKNDVGDPILDSPANPALGDATNLAANIGATFSFDTVEGVVYDVVCIDANGVERVVATVVGTGNTVTTADQSGDPIDASAVYEVRAVDFEDQ